MLLLPSEEIPSLGRKLSKKAWMIGGEGSVFLVILLVGAWWIRRSFKAEQALSLQQSNFMLSITHELKSPLAGIRLNTQTLERKNLEDHQKEKLIRNSLSETHRLELLVEKILMASKMESGDNGFSWEKLNLTALLRGMKESIAIREQNVAFERSSNDLIIYGDPFAIEAMVLNLVENALKYSKEGQQVTISVTEKNGKVVLAVADEGPGLTESDKRKVFEKFYRVGSENTRRNKGTGIGLYLVIEVVNYHKGIIRILNNKPSGCIFEIQLPKA